VAGIFTQSRKLKVPWPFVDRYPPPNQDFLSLPWRISVDGGVTYPSNLERTYLVFPQIPYQTTTSFRSNGPYGDDYTSPGWLLKANEEKNRYPFDNGHEFYTRKLTYKASHKDVVLEPTYNPLERLRGPLVPAGVFNRVTDWMSTSTFGPMDLDKASNALKSTIPTKSAAGLATALGELLVDLPRLPLATIMNARTLKGLASEGGGNYLNTVFAWQPLVQDVLKVCRAIVYAQQIINQYERDSGRQIRRSFSYPVEYTNQDSWNGVDRCIDAFFVNNYNSGLFYGYYNGTFQEAAGAYSGTVNTDTQYWFKGAWMYHIENGTTILDKINQAGQYANKLLGVKLTPEVLWNIAPWSWLLDWFANIGDIIAINTALGSDSLVLRYGYFMRHTTRTLDADHSGVNFTKFHPGPVTFQAKLEEKQRVRSTPYGFGLNTETFTTQQWAILAALGLTKGDRKMWWG